MMNWPKATLSTLLVTAGMTGLQYVYPQLLSSLERTPSAFVRHQWWRLITPLLLQPDRWCAVTLVFTSILVVGSFAERLWGSRRWLILYTASGAAGEIAGYSWHLYGAGASVGGSGLLGSLATWLSYKNQTVPAKFGGLSILLAGVILSCIRDIHGPPILVGACIGLLMFKLDKSEAQQGHTAPRVDKAQSPL